MKISDLFEIKYGVNLELSACERTDWRDEDGINFVARTSANNGKTTQWIPCFDL